MGVWPKSIRFMTQLLIRSPTSLAAVNTIAQWTVTLTSNCTKWMSNNGNARSVAAVSSISCSSANKFLGLQQNEHSHDHDVDIDINGLTCEFKKLVVGLMKTIKYPKQIRSHINSNKKTLFPENPNIETPALSKIQNFFYYTRQKETPTSIKIIDMANFVEQHQYAKDMDPKQMFVFGVSSVIGDGSATNHFGIGLTFLALLANVDASNQNNVAIYHIDGTYKLTTNNFVLVVFGRTDIQRQFHPIAFWWTSHEETGDYI